MQDNPLTFVLLNLDSVAKKGKKLHKFKYFQNYRVFLDEIRYIFRSLGRTIDC